MNALHRKKVFRHMKVTRCLSVVAVLLFNASLHADVASRVKEFESLAAAPEVATVSGVSYSIGHLKVDLASGRAAYVLAGKERVGLYFRGNGTYRYEAEASELPIVTANVRKSDQKIDGSTVSGKFDEILLLARGSALPALSGSGGAAVGDELSRHLEHFTRSRDIPAAHGYVLHELAFPEKKYVHAEMSGGGDLLVYNFDEGESAHESLHELRQLDVADPTLKRWLLPIVLSSQPIGLTHTAVAPAPFTLTAIDYTLIGDGDNAKLTMTETIARGAGQNAIRLGMMDVDIVRLGVAPRRYHVDSIVDASSGRKLPFDHRQESLLVGLDGVSGDSVKLTFSISGDFLIRPNNDNFWQLGVINWFPQPDLGGQFYTIHSVVKVRKPFVPFAPGKTIARTQEGEFNVVENVVDTPVQFAVVHAGKYDIFEDKRGDVTIRVASYAGKNDRAAKQLTNIAFSVIDYYQFFLGPFPFPQVNVIQVNTYGYGQAPPGTIFITNEAFNSTLGELNQIFSQGINERFAHEIAHFYWGHVVKMPSGEEQWITESFAEYSAGLALKKLQGRAVFDRMVAIWKQRAGEATKAAPIAYANRISGDPMNAAIARQGLLYNKGPYLLYLLNKELGDDKFLTFLKTYQKSRRWKFGNTADMANLLQFLTKKDYMPFFEKYYWGGAMPE